MTFADPYNRHIREIGKEAERSNMERKPYYILRIFCSNFILHEGILREIYPNHGHGGGMQLYLTDEEVHKYNHEAICEVLRPYADITVKRCHYMPAELILYAISEVLYGNAKEICYK